MLLWSVLYLTETRAVNAQYERLGEPAVTLDDIRHFRQLGSKAPGHPEYHLTSGVEATTGPLGQGIADSVGMATARKWLASRYNKPGFDLFDYNVYVVCGDGCLMEGVGSEAASLAGHLGLDDLCWIYDNNHITIDGNTRITFTEDVAARFLAYHWNVLRVGDANDLESIAEALAVFRKTKDRPTLIILDSHIGFGSPHKVDTSAAHGEPLGEDEVRLVKRAYHWPENAEFFVPEGVMEHFADGIGKRGGKARRDWEAMFAKYRERFPYLATEIDQMQVRELPVGWDRNLPSFPPDSKGMAGHRAYRQEPDVARNSTTETYIACKLHIDNWRWAGVPFYLRTGKYMKRRSTEIAIRFHQAPYALFRGTDVERMHPNWMILRIQPDEGIALEFAAKHPGPTVTLNTVSMDFAYKTYFKIACETGYETLIYDCMIGDATLFHRADTVENGWQVVQPILDTWADNPPRDFPNSVAGSDGPAAADELLARDGRAWRPLD
jgi:transketolase N-terminal domain/subunit